MMSSYTYDVTIKTYNKVVHVSSLSWFSRRHTFFCIWNIFGIFEIMQKVKPMCLKNEIQHDDIDDILAMLRFSDGGVLAFFRS